jgi:nicotinate-nucleotide pyrophosphorylase (carboxylating)
LDDLTALVARALAEDVGDGDVTTNAIIPEHGAGIGILVANEDCVLAGLEPAREVFRQLADVQFPHGVNDGDHMKKGDHFPFVVGSLRAVLTGERVALNFLQRLSGIATITRRYVEAAPHVMILDTRKTTPGLRDLEKAAVRAGGGANHRFGLYDAILIKDNHVAVAGGIRQAIDKARQASKLPIEVECDTLDQVREALEAEAERILLDNMDVGTLREAVEIVGGRSHTEASGGVTLETVRDVAKTGVDSISVGALTHSARAIDLSLDVRPE